MGVASEWNLCFLIETSQGPKTETIVHCPTPTAALCRREFGCLQVFTVSHTSHVGVKL